MSGPTIRSFAVAAGAAGALLVILGADFTVGGPGATQAQTVPSSARPGSRACALARTLKSQHAREPTKITFINKAATYRGLNWIDYSGQQMSYGGLNPGETKVLDTFRTHPWVVSTGPGDCIRIYLPAAEPATVVLK